MTDSPKPPAPETPTETPPETPIERALRLKTAALKAKTNPPGRGGFQPRQGAGIAAGASKPAMKK